MRVAMRSVDLFGSFMVSAFFIGGLCLLMTASGCGPAETTVGENDSEQNMAADEGGHDGHEGHDHGGHDHGEHEHDHDAATLAEATVKLEEVFNKISQGFADGDPESVHHELHEVGHLLEAIEGKAMAGEGLADGKKETAEQAVTALFEGFTTLDDSLHGKQDADIEGAKTKIKDGLDKLKESLK